MVEWSLIGEAYSGHCLQVSPVLSVHLLSCLGDWRVAGPRGQSTGGSRALRAGPRGVPRPGPGSPPRAPPGCPTTAAAAPPVTPSWWRAGPATAGRMKPYRTTRCPATPTVQARPTVKVGGVTPARPPRPASAAVTSSPRSSAPRALTPSHCLRVHARASSPHQAPSSHRASQQAK